jgi:hypothetical protein
VFFHGFATLVSGQARQPCSRRALELSGYLACRNRRRNPQEEGECEYASDHHGGSGESEAHLEPAVLYQPLGEAREGEAGGSGSAVPLCVEGSEAPCGRYTGGRGPGEKCGSMYEHKPCHHGGGGHGTPQAKKKCPPNYSEIPLVHLCISFEWPSDPSPAPSYGPSFGVSCCSWLRCWREV